MSREIDPSSVPSSPARGIVALVAANASLLVAILVYMGWAYEDALFGYFQIRPFDLGVGVVEYMLRSLSLFSIAIVPAAVVLIAAAAARTWGIGQTTLGQRVIGVVRARMSAIPGFGLLVSGDVAQERRAARALLIAVGAGVTVTALVLAWIAGHVQVSTYWLLFLFGVGPLLLTWRLALTLMTVSLMRWPSLFRRCAPCGGVFVRPEPGIPSGSPGCAKPFNADRGGGV